MGPFATAQHLSYEASFLRGFQALHIVYFPQLKKKNPHGLRLRILCTDFRFFGIDHDLVSSVVLRFVEGHIRPVEE
ncbi:hypothetical protein D3C73_1477980 [compost metagenome]